MDPITSHANPKIKRIRRLLQDGRFRQREQQFVVEGSRWIKELVTQRCIPDLWLATPDWLIRHPELAADLTTLARPPLLVDERVFASLTNTATPAGVLAVVPVPQQPWPVDPTLLIVLDGLRDPGNAGTILRTAAAAGVDGILVGPGTVDLTNPKVVRSSMGAILRLPQRPLRWEALDQHTGRCQLLAADINGSIPYTAFDWATPAALIIGGEAHGLSAGARQAAAQRLMIPMAGTTESLNAAVAAAIMLFEAQRQRRKDDSFD